MMIRCMQVLCLAMVGLVALSILRGGTDGQDAGRRMVMDYLRPAGACSAPTGPDDFAAVPTGWTLAGDMIYHTNPATFPKSLDAAAVEGAFSDAMSVWSATDAPNLALGADTSIKSSKLDGTNVIVFGGVPYGALAVAKTWVDRSGKVAESDIIFSKSFAWSTNPSKSEEIDGACGGEPSKFDVQNIAAHELGHPVGLKDLRADDADAQTMYGLAGTGELYKRSLASGDAVGANGLYPP